MFFPYVENITMGSRVAKNMPRVLKSSFRHRAIHKVRTQHFSKKLRMGIWGCEMCVIQKAW